MEKRKKRKRFSIKEDKEGGGGNARLLFWKYLPKEELRYETG